MGLGWRSAGGWKGLDDPEGPLVLAGNVDEVHVGRVGCVAFANVLNGGLVPRCLHRFGVQSPLDKGLGLGRAVADDGEADVEDAGGGNCFVGRDVERDPGDEVEIRVFAGRCWGVIARAVAWSGAVGTFVGENSDAIGDLVSAATCLRDNMEPVA